MFLITAVFSGGFAGDLQEICKVPRPRQQDAPARVTEQAKIRPPSLEESQLQSQQMRVKGQLLCISFIHPAASASTNTPHFPMKENESPLTSAQHTKQAVFTINCCLAEFLHAASDEAPMSPHIMPFTQDQRYQWIDSNL